MDNQEKENLKIFLETIDIRQGLYSPGWKGLSEEEKRKRKKMAAKEKAAFAKAYRKAANAERARQEAKTREEAKTPTEKRAAEAWAKYKAAPKGDPKRTKWKAYAIACAVKATDEGKGQDLPGKLKKAAERKKEAEAARNKAEPKEPKRYLVAEFTEGGELKDFKTFATKRQANKSAEYRKRTHQNSDVWIEARKAEPPTLEAIEAAWLCALTKATAERAKGHKKAEAIAREKADQAKAEYKANGGSHEEPKPGTDKA